MSDNFTGFFFEKLSDIVRSPINGEAGFAWFFLFKYMECVCYNGDPNNPVSEWRCSILVRNIPESWYYKFKDTKGFEGYEMSIVIIESVNCKTKKDARNWVCKAILSQSNRCFFRFENYLEVVSRYNDKYVKTLLSRDFIKV
jgi:hypothetical protein